ncbi:hypothetical protein E1B28_005310 [Marasmius oreades]|uniref:Uncharacterized protein n=1 Tax=Marasmius oreades TaxID=181124 RepID=A0A9P7V0H8_9AGAR|nr:uncharacterized protein E1B28_005310 [Marasmius oreades]KAG7098002.1 hypothetical protein E1B28_005310 [Marasmius oreades]
MAFVGTSGSSIQGGAHNTVHGNQIITLTTHAVQHHEKEYTEYDEYDNIKRGHLYMLKDLYFEECPMRWDSYQQQWVIFRAKRTINTAEILHQEHRSRVTVISYCGPQAKEAWEDDFHQFSQVQWVDWRQS